MRPQWRPAFPPKWQWRARKDEAFGATRDAAPRMRPASSRAGPCPLVSARALGRGAAPGGLLTAQVRLDTGDLRYCILGVPYSHNLMSRPLATGSASALGNGTYRACHVAHYRQVPSQGLQHPGHVDRSTMRWLWRRREVGPTSRPTRHWTAVLPYSPPDPTKRAVRGRIGGGLWAICDGTRKGGGV